PRGGLSAARRSSQAAVAMSARAASSAPAPSTAARRRRRVSLVDTDQTRGPALSGRGLAVSLVLVMASFPRGSEECEPFGVPKPAFLGRASAKPSDQTGA